jgi:hypothetical protein
MNPVISLLEEIAATKATDKNPSAEEQEFRKQIKELNEFTTQVGALADKLFLSPRGALLLKLLKLFL